MWSTATWSLTPGPPLPSGEGELTVSPAMELRHRALERKSGWCGAMCARRSICTTKSGTAAAAGWKGAGRSMPVGEYARTTSARNGDDHPLITGQRRCSIVGRLEDQVDRLPCARVRRHPYTRGKGAGVRERDPSWIGAHIRPRPPPHRHGVLVGI